MGTRKIIWAVNPFGDDSETVRSAAWALRALAKDGPVEVEPVHIWQGTPLEPPAGPVATLLAEFQKHGQDALDSVLARVKIPGVKPLRIIPSNTFTIRGATRTIVDHARDEGAELIVTCSHGRKGVKRAVLGSFAETLTLQSDVPIFVLRPGWRRTPELRQIVFLTDFSDESRQAFAKVVDFAKAHGSRILIYNKAVLPPYPTFEFGHAVYAVAGALLGGEKLAEAEAQKLAKFAADRGVRVAVFVDRSMKGSVVDGALKRARRLGALVALSSQSGAVTSALLGSVTRHLLRASEQPVWVIHPSRQSAVKPLYDARKDAAAREVPIRARGHG